MTEVETASLSDRRFGGMARLYGREGAQKVQHAHVVVVGIGGVGSWAAEAVARAGVGRITLIDMDHISESNINRQLHADSTTLGMAKVDAMAERIRRINPEALVHCVDDFVSPDNVSVLFEDARRLGQGAFAVIDACDQLRAKVAMANWCLQHHESLVVVGAAGGKRLAHAVEAADLVEVTHDPLLASMRQRLRQRHGAARKGKMQIDCIFSREAVLQSQLLCETQGSQSDNSLNCHGYGSSVAVTSVFGFAAAGLIINKIAEQGKQK